MWCVYKWLFCLLAHSLDCVFTLSTPFSRSMLATNTLALIFVFHTLTISNFMINWINRMVECPNGFSIRKKTQVRVPVQNYFSLIFLFTFNVSKMMNKGFSVTAFIVAITVLDLQRGILSYEFNFNRFECLFFIQEFLFIWKFLHLFSIGIKLLAMFIGCSKWRLL